MPVIAELDEVLDVYERKDSPSWDYDVSSCHFILMPSIFQDFMLCECLNFESYDKVKNT